MICPGFFIYKNKLYIPSNPKIPPNITDENPTASNCPNSFCLFSPSFEADRAKAPKVDKGLKVTICAPTTIAATNA